MEDRHEEAPKPRMLVLAPQQQPAAEEKTPLKNSRRRKTKELVDARRGCIWGTPSLCPLARSCHLLSVVFVYFSVDIHEVILDDLINRRLNGPTVLLI